MKNVLPFVLIAALGAGNAYAQQEPGRSNAAQVQTPTSGAKTGSGTDLIQSIDNERGTVTIKHGPIQGLNMSGMTMSFPVRDKAILAKLQPLQKVEFELSYDGKDYRITTIN